MKLFIDNKKIVTKEYLINNLEDGMIAIGIYDSLWDKSYPTDIDDGRIISVDDDLLGIKGIIIAKLDAKVKISTVDDFDNLWDTVKKIKPDLKESFDFINYNGYCYIYNMDEEGYKLYPIADYKEIDYYITACDDMCNKLVISKKDSKYILKIIENHIKKVYRNFFGIESFIVKATEDYLEIDNKDFNMGVKIHIKNKKIGYLANTYADVKLDKEKDQILAEFDIIVD